MTEIEKVTPLPPEKRSNAAARILVHYNEVMPETYQLDILQLYIMKLVAQKVASEPEQILEESRSTQPPKYVSFFDGQFELTRASGPLDVINVTLDFWWGTSIEFRNEIEFLNKQCELYDKSTPVDRYEMDTIDFLISIREKILKKKHQKGQCQRAQDLNSTIFQHRK